MILQISQKAILMRHEVPVSIEIPKGYELVDEVTTGVEISKISTADESN